MTLQTYATKVTAHYIARRQAAEAGGSRVNFVGGTLIVGDGNGSVPLVSDLISANGVTHEVWRGSAVHAVSINADNPAELDILLVIPAADENAVEIGPFWVREFVILDETNQVCVVGITQVEKTTSAQGQTSDLSWIAGIAESNADVVILTPPSAGFASQTEVVNAVNASLHIGEEPIYISSSLVDGIKHWLHKIRRAAQADQVLGVTRPATDEEFAAGVPMNGSNTAWPYATLQQIKAAFTGFHVPAALAPLSRHIDAGAGIDQYEIKTADKIDIGAGRAATDSEFIAGGPAYGSLTLWPWPTIGQVKAYVASKIPGALAPIMFDPDNYRYYARLATTGLTGVGRVATSAEITNRASADSYPTPWIPVTAMPPDAWGIGVGAVIFAVGIDGGSGGPTITGAQLKSGTQIGQNQQGYFVGINTSGSWDARIPTISNTSVWQQIAAHPVVNVYGSGDGQGGGSYTTTALLIFKRIL